MSSLDELRERVRRFEERVRALEEEFDSTLTADDLMALRRPKKSIGRVRRLLAKSWRKSF